MSARESPWLSSAVNVSAISSADFHAVLGNAAAALPKAAPWSVGTTCCRALTAAAGGGSRFASMLVALRTYKPGGLLLPLATTSDRTTVTRGKVIDVDLELYFRNEIFSTFTESPHTSSHAGMQIGTRALKRYMYYCTEPAQPEIYLFILCSKKA